MFEAVKHNIKWYSKIGYFYRHILMNIGLLFLDKGRKILKISGGRCSWCGRNPGSNSSVSRKGLRCYGHEDF